MVNPYCLTTTNKDYQSTSDQGTRMKNHRKSRTPHQSPPERERSKSLASRFSASPPMGYSTSNQQLIHAETSGFELKSENMKPSIYINQKLRSSSTRRKF